MLRNKWTNEGNKTNNKQYLCTLKKKKGKRKQICIILFKLSELLYTLNQGNENFKIINEIEGYIYLD